MAEQDKKISALTTVTEVSASDLALATVEDTVNPGVYNSRKITEGDKAKSYLNAFGFPLLLTKTAHDTVIGALNDIAFKELSGTLTTGTTSLTISDASITTSSTVDIFADVYGVSPESVTVATGSITMTFEARESDLSVKVRVY